MAKEKEIDKISEEIHLTFKEAVRVGKPQTPEGKKWKISLIQAGWSKNNRYYPSDLLMDAAQLFEGVKVYAYKFGSGEGNKVHFDHIPEEVRQAVPEGCSLNVVGWCENIRFESSGDFEGLTGEFHTTDDWCRKTLLNAFNEGKMDLLGFSIDIEGNVSKFMHDGKVSERVTSIDKINELTLVSNPAAGGQVMRLVASAEIEVEDSIETVEDDIETVGEGIENEASAEKDIAGNETTTKETSEGDTSMETKEKLLEMIRAHDATLLEGLDLNAITEEELLALLEKALAAKKQEAEVEETPEEPEEAQQESTELAEKLDAFLKLVEEKSLQEDDSVVAGLKKLKELIAGGNMAEATQLVDALIEKMSAYGMPQESEEEDEEAKEEDAMKINEATAKMQAQMKAMEDRFAKRETQMVLGERLAEANLPKPVETKLRKQFEGKVATEKEIREAIALEQDTLAAMSKTGLILGLKDQASSVVEVGDEPLDKYQKGMDLLLDPSLAGTADYKGIERLDGVREAYTIATGDSKVRGVMGQSRLTEATVSSFSNALGTSITRKMVKDYGELDQTWRKYVIISSVNDFKQQDIIRWGGFANLAAVAEAGTYAAFGTDPAEDHPTYSASKRGNLFVVTREMILNDDLRFLRRIPTKLARAANRTLNQFVYDLILSYTSAINDTAIYDSVVLYHAASHANLGSSALAYSTLNTGVIAMMKQTEATSSAVLGLRPKYLLVPPDLKSTAEVLINSEKKPELMDNDINPYYKSMEIDVSVYLRSDTNNWYLIADPADGDWIEVGFVQGQETPEILLQDGETTGTVFTDDEITYKVRHEYGGAVLDYRGFYGAVVA